MFKKLSIFFLIFLIYSSIFSKNILILHSYNPLNEWARDFNKGIENVLFESEHNIHIEYLYSRINFSEEYKKNFVDVLLHRYKKIDIHAIITTDQRAFEFATEYKGKLGLNAPVFFAGAELSKYSGINYNDDFFGIFDEVSLEKNIELIDKIYPQQKILIINNKDEVGEKIINEIKYLKNQTNIISINLDNFYDIINEIAKYPSDNPILLGNLEMIKDEKILHPKEVSKELEKVLENPIFTLWNNQIGYGAIGGYVTDGVKEGENLAEMILSYFENPNIQKYDNGDYFYKFDYQKLKKYGINQQLLPKNSVIINKPEQIINKFEFWIIIILIHILLLITLYSIYIMMKMRREKKFIENESFKDTLTNVYNRKKLESIKPMLEDKAMRKELVTYVVDLDNLKLINDTFGHDIGDKFIIYTAEILKEVFEKKGYVFRIGGDEFCIVTFLGLNKLKENINELNDKLDYLIQKKRNELDKPFNLSYGYAVKRSFENIDQAFKRADKKMYKNKQNNKIDR